MKTLIVSSLFFICSLSTFSQKVESSYLAGIIFKLSPLPFLGEFVHPGHIKIANDSLFFDPRPCTVADKKFVGIVPCVGNQIKPMAISFSEIKRIRNRAYLFFIPNRLLIVTNSNDGYLFITYRRRKIRRAFANYLANKSSAIASVVTK